MGPQPPENLFSRSGTIPPRPFLRRPFAEIEKERSRPEAPPSGMGGQASVGWGFGWRSDSGRARRARHLLNRGESQSRAKAPGGGSPGLQAAQRMKVGETRSEAARKPLTATGERPPEKYRWNEATRPRSFLRRPFTLRKERKDLAL